jgi:GH15 family glucan-1,4-alpha-glucosidase
MVNKAKILIEFAQDEAKLKMNAALNVFRKEIDNDVILKEFKSITSIEDKDKIGRTLLIRYKFDEYNHPVKVFFHYNYGTYHLEFHDDRAMSSKQKLIFHQAKLAIEHYITGLNND